VSAKRKGQEATAIAGRQPRGRQRPRLSPGTVVSITENGCESVLIFRDPTPPPTLGRRSCIRAQRIGGLRPPVAAQAAAVRDQGGYGLGDLSGRPNRIHAYASFSWPPEERSWDGNGPGVGRPHGQRTQTCRHRSTPPPASTTAGGTETDQYPRAIPAQEVSGPLGTSANFSSKM